MIWFGRYEGVLRSLCRGMKDGDTECCKAAAYIFCSMLPENAIICPMPGHEGKPTYMKDVCYEVFNIRNDVVIWEGLRCVPHESSYHDKKMGIVPDPPTMMVEEDDPIPFGTVFVLDNVIATGRTAAATEALGLVVLAIAKDMRRV